MKCKMRYHWQHQQINKIQCQSLAIYQWKMRVCLSPLPRNQFNSWHRYTLVVTEMKGLFVRWEGIVGLLMLILFCLYQRWESSSFHPNSGFLMIPKVILEICQNLWRKVVCVYVHCNYELLMLCAPAAIMSTILYKFRLSWVVLEA